ncbi:enoyl-CoA hydratase-related protein [Nocardioides pyridinolyticus]
MAVITLDDAPHRNAITLELAASIDQVMTELEADDTISAVVVTGAGSAFCAGADLDVLLRGDLSEYRRLYDAFLRLSRSSLLTIAAVNGAATGAGFNLALCCDLRVVSPKARFIARFLEIGLHPGGSHTWMLQRAVGAQLAKALVLCGEELDGQRSVDAGLAIACVEPEELVRTAVDLGARAGSVPRELLIRTKATMALGEHCESQDEAVEMEARAQLWSTTLPYFRDRVAAMRARIHGRS